MSIRSPSFVDPAGERVQVTDFEITILVHKDVGGLEISMHDASRVNVFKPSLNRVSLPDTSEIHPEWDLQEFDRESTE